MKGNQCPSQGKGENGSVKGAASGKGVDEVAAAAGIGGRIGKPSSDKRLQKRRQMG